MFQKNIRNFAIIAHVDHGKSTLADRLLELTGVVKAGEHQEQMLDRNPISRERGITIKLAPVTMQYGDYTLNLIDTPGHVDFSYEVDRTLACVEGVILLVDATQGIQAQTISNAYKAIEKNLVIIPVINKIDMPSAEIDKTESQLVEFLGIKKEEIYKISAKTGEGVKELLKMVVEKIPGPLFVISNEMRDLAIEESVNKNASPGTELHLASLDFSPKARNDKILRSLIFDSYYDQHRGVIAFVRVFDGELKRGLNVQLGVNRNLFNIIEVGIFSPELKSTEILGKGNIGYVVTNLKDIHKVQVGDTIIDAKNLSTPLSGYKKVKSMVYASIFPTDPQEYINLKKALEKLYLTDSALELSPIYSRAMGAGFRVGFLGLLHADVVRERLEREFNQSVVITPPQVDYLTEDKNGKKCFKEPIVKITIVTPQEYLGSVMKLCEESRGNFLFMDNKTSQIFIQYELPMSEMVSNFFDNLKSVTSGYASFDWELLRYEVVDADKLIILLNEDEIDEFSEVVVSARAQEKAQILVKKFKEVIDRQQYEVKIQAKYKGKIIASERISPFRKNVLVKSGKVIGAGDVGRKRKLLEKQKEGKKKLKMVGKVEITKDAFLKLFRKN